MNEIQSKFRKYFYNEVTAAIALIGLTVGVIQFFSNQPQKNADNINLIQSDIRLMQEQIGTIKNNDIKHIEAIILELKEFQKSLDAKQSEMDKKIERILTILNK
jgi:hypothetical protein